MTDRSDLPIENGCSYCSDPAVGWFWSLDQGYIGWCRDHVDWQSIRTTYTPGCAERFHDRLEESCQPMRDPYHSDPTDPT